MLKNYFKIAIRNLTNHWTSTFINIFGLTCGITAFLLITLYVRDELSYDKFHKNADRIYRISREWFNDDGKTNLHLGALAPPFGPLLKNDFDGVVLEEVRILPAGNALISLNDKSIVEDNIFFADADFFNLFTFHLLEGSPSKVLSEPNSVVLNKTLARKYFGTEDPIGKTIRYENLADFKVTGVVEDPPHNSHFRFNMLVSMKTVEPYFGGQAEMMSNWGSNNFYTYILLPKGYDPNTFSRQLPAFLDKHLGDWNGKPASHYNQLNLWPITSIHLHSNLDSEIESNGKIELVYIYSVVALFILFIACFNFINLATAKSVKRAREVGLRKVMGANRGMLIKQFLTETLILAIFSSAFALFLLMVLLPWFNGFTDKHLTIQFTNDLFLPGAIVVIAMFVGVVAGSYPAFFLSSFKPATVLKGAVKLGSSKSVLRSSLVVAQFTISLTLIIGVWVIFKQLNYVKSKSLGFDQHNILVLPENDSIYRHFDNIKQQILRQPGVINVTMSSRVPSGRLLDSQGGNVEVGKDMVPLSFRLADVHVDHDFLNTLNATIKAGRNFNVQRASDSSEAFILNEAAVRAIGYASNEKAIDKKMNYGSRKGRIIGVVGDFNFESLHQKIAPIVFVISKGRTDAVLVKFNKKFQQDILQFLQKEWSFYIPGYPFQYSLLNEKFDQQYDKEANLGKLITYFSMLALLIACLGLFGLSSYTTEQRTKEIGIRKVLGSTIFQIVLMLTKGVTKLIFIALIIAVPVSFLIMNHWLNSFAYHDTIGLLVFIGSGIIVLTISLLTIAYESIKASLINPAITLRSE